MANPGWYRSDPDDMIVLPKTYEWESEDYQVDETDITNITLRGVEYTNKLYSQETPSFLFHMVSLAQLNDFRTLHDAVGGNLRTFWFVPDSDIPSVKLFVKKEPGFKPKKLGGFGSNGPLTDCYDYLLQLRQQVAAAQILI